MGIFVRAFSDCYCLSTVVAEIPLYDEHRGHRAVRIERWLQSSGAGRWARTWRPSVRNYRHHRRTAWNEELAGRQRVWTEDVILQWAAILKVPPLDGMYETRARDAPCPTCTKPHEEAGDVAVGESRGLDGSGSRVEDVSDATPQHVRIGRNHGRTITLGQKHGLSHVHCMVAACALAIVKICSSLRYDQPRGATRCKQISSDPCSRRYLRVEKDTHALAGVDEISRGVLLESSRDSKTASFSTIPLKSTSIVRRHQAVVRTIERERGVQLSDVAIAVETCPAT